MNKFFAIGAISAALIVGATFTPMTSEPAHAGCLTGAVVGGLAGHFLGHHGIAGAAAGCAGGALMKRHNENVQRQHDLDDQYNNRSTTNYLGTTNPYNR